MPSSGACEVCGGANETRSRFCPDCRDERESRQRRESSIRWKRSHPSLVKAEKERYRKDHLAYFATASRVYREANKEKVAAAQRVRVKRHNATLDLWKRAQGCSTCGVTEGKLHYHHIDPSS